MTATLQHVGHLMSLRRYREAADRLRLALADDPDDAHLHALLGRCLSLLGEHAPAIAECRTAVGLDPEVPFHHHALGAALLADSQNFAADKAAAEALRLDPDEPDHYALAASCRLRRDLKRQALSLVDEGLQRDPDHGGLRDLHAHLLTLLGRGAEAHAAIERNLQDDPDDPEAHANRGWMLIHQNRPGQARTHLLESLRLDPDNHWARQGLLECLRALNPAYRLFLAVMLRLARLEPTWRFAIFALGYVAYRLANLVSTYHSDWWYLLRPVVWLYLGFAVLVWTARPVSDIALLLHPTGRHCLDLRQRRAALVAALPLGTALAGLIGWLISGHAIGLWIALLAVILTDRCYEAVAEPVRRHRCIMLAGCAVLAVLATISSVLVWQDSLTGLTIFRAFFWIWLGLLVLDVHLNRDG